MQEDAALLGLVLPEADEEDADFAVWPDNWRAVLLFTSLGTAWRIDGASGNYFGLDYPAVAVVMAMQGVIDADKAELFNGLQVMERAALEVLNKK